MTWWLSPRTCSRGMPILNTPLLFLHLPLLVPATVVVTAIMGVAGVPRDERVVGYHAVSRASPDTASSSPRVLTRTRASFLHALASRAAALRCLALSRAYTTRLPLPLTISVIRCAGRDGIVTQWRRKMTFMTFSGETFLRATPNDTTHHTAHAAHLLRTCRTRTARCTTHTRTHARTHATPHTARTHTALLLEHGRWRTSMVNE